MTILGAGVCGNGLGGTIRNAGLEVVPYWLNLAIRGKDARGADGAVFWGDPGVFEQEAVVADLNLPYGSWQIGALPQGGWAIPLKHFTPPVLLYSLVASMLVAWNIVVVRLYGRMRGAEKKAQRLNRAKSEFLANMSHEILTPLNAVIGYSELLMDSDLSDTQRDFARSAHASGETLLAIINDTLDYSKIEAVMMKLELADVNLIELNEHSLELVRPTAEKKKLELLLDIEPNVPSRIWADSLRLKQILKNLLGNAVKFTARGEIALCARCERAEGNQKE